MSKGLVRQGARVIDKIHHFVVTAPSRWYSYEGGDVPCFFTFAAETSDQGELPPDGASICMLVASNNEPQSEPTLSAWARHLVRQRHGTNVEWSNTNGPKSTESAALWITFDSPAFAKELQPLRYVLVLWEYRGSMFGAELAYRQEDVNGKSILGDLVHSFTPIPGPWWPAGVRKDSDRR
jgi:hypothetical protein